jgi:S1-C subfamily serine protease
MYVVGAALIVTFLMTTEAIAISLPEQVPGIAARTAQKDKAAVVLINSIVTGTAVMPSFSLIQGGTAGSGGLEATWQSPLETVTFSQGGQFTGTNLQTGFFSGTYSVQGNTITATFTYPIPTVVVFTYTISADTLTLSNPQLGTDVYTRATPATPASDDVVENAKTLLIVKQEGPAATLLTEQVSSGASGTGFIVSPDGYVVTNAHVVLAGKDQKTMLVEALAGMLQNQLLAEASQYYNIPPADKEQVVQVLFEKFAAYFAQNGDITEITLNHYVVNGIASPGEDLKVKSWSGVVRKQGTVYEKIEGEISWGQDVAVIKVETTHQLPTVTLGDSSKIQIGDPIFIIGYPGFKLEGFFKASSTLEPTVTQGVISARRTLKTGVEAIQTDCAINHGNSGGPAYNDQGEVVGIATFGAGPEDGIEAIKFMMPISLGQQYMSELNVENEHTTLDEKYLEGLTAFWNRDCQIAIDRMEEVLTLYPGHPYAQDYINEAERAMMAGEVSKPMDLTLIALLVGIGGSGGAVTGIVFYRKRVTVH